MLIDNVFTLDEIKKLATLGNYLTVSTVEQNNNCNKNLGYHLDISPFKSIIKPKLDKIIGADHVVGASSLKECTSPYTLHFDTAEIHEELVLKNPTLINFSNSNKKYDTAVLIPMVEGPNYKTSIFGIDYTNSGKISYDPLSQEWLCSSNSLNLDDYDHHSSSVLKDFNRLPLLEELPWKLGSIIIWDRKKLHCSSNFAKFGLTKKMIVLFVE